MSFNVYLCLIVVIFALQSITCDSSLNHFQTDPDISIVSKVLNDFVDVFLTFETFDLSIFKYKMNSNFLKDILSEFLVTISDRFPCCISAYLDGKRFSMPSHFLFMEYFENFNFIE